MNLYRDPYGIVPVVEPVIVGMGYDFWGFECQLGVKTAHVRIYIDRQEGVTLDDCSRVSQQLSAVLDVEDPIQVPYTLEISSPGINRPLFSAEQMKSAIGNKVKVKTLWAIEERRNFKGTLEEVGDENIMINIESDTFLSIPMNAIKSAKLDLDIKFND